MKNPQELIGRKIKGFRFNDYVYSSGYENIEELSKLGLTITPQAIKRFNL